MGFSWDSLRDYGAIVDVRSPAEYRIDRIPGAVNLPVLGDSERAEVGTLYKSDPFAARRRGLALVAANLAAMAQQEFAERGPDWRPLVYCWRGGMRSGTVVEAMRKVGWKADALPGGYRGYRAKVREAIAELPEHLGFVVLCGPTGVGKTQLLAELEKLGQQTIDLEGLANHRGSLFGGRGEQPSQKLFESMLAARLTALDRSRPVFIESESRMIGRVNVPRQLLAAMHAGRPLVLEADLASRARLTVRCYLGGIGDGDFERITAGLARYAGNAQVEQWRRLWREGEHEELAASLLEIHYDRKYASSLGRNYDLASADLRYSYSADDPGELRGVAAEIAAAAGGA